MGLREYETVYILKPDVTEDAVTRVHGKLSKALEDYKGVLLEHENWGTRKKLAYDIAKHSKGNYFFFHFMGGGGLVGEIERHLKLDDVVLRFMTVKVDEDADPEVRLKAVHEKPKTAAPISDDDDDNGGRRRDRGDRDRHRSDSMMGDDGDLESDDDGE